AAVLDGAQLPFGGHKGTALQLMIELLAGAMIGDAMSFDALAVDDGAGAPPLHGELILAFDPARFGTARPGANLEHAEELFARFGQQQGARLPSERRYEARARSAEHGVLIPANVHRELLALLPSV